MVNEGDINDGEFPGGVTYCSRLQSLAATFQGDLLNCITAEGTIDLGDESCLTEESVELTLQTLAAHAFNFYSMDMKQGVYDITVWANAECKDGEDAVACDPVVDGADARAWIGMGSMVVDEVRFTNK